MFLCIDCGNTRTKANVFSAEGGIVAQVRQKHLRQSWLQKIIDTYPIQATILCSVVLHDPAAETFLQNKMPLVLLSHTIALPIRLAYLTPETLGRDRIAAVAGARYLFPDENVLVIDAGTCIKYDFLDSAGIHQGGSIAPGIGMRLKAMHEYTAKLPLIERQHLSDFIGKNTEMALRTGGQFGAAMEADGFILKYKKQFGEIRVVATGGDAPFIKRYTQQTVEHQPDLLMQGLFAILQQNILPT